MCTNTRYLRNKYTGKSFVCNCGHCKSCLQEKAAARTLRIRSEYDDQHIVLFVTLTYDRISCPYICKSDISLVSKKRMFMVKLIKFMDQKQIFWFLFIVIIPYIGMLILRNMFVNGKE